MSRSKTLFISLIILLISAGITTIVFFTEPEAQREGATKKTAMLVDVVQVQRGNYRPTVTATGTVQPAKDITLSPRVSGEIIRLSENFTPGAFVKKGELLLQIDPSDYRNTLQLRKSDLELAKANLRVEMGRQDVAQKDYELIGGDDLSEENKALVLRKPQLESAKANVAAAEASVRQAELDLKRTTIRAPFDAHIITRNANVGSQVGIGDNLGRLVGIEEYWVIANVPISKINWLSFAEGGNDGSEVKIMNDNIWPRNQYRTGKLFRLVGALDNETRLARVLITVTDPLARTKNNTVPPLMIGTFVETHIQAREIRDIVRLNRDYLRKDQTVWIMEKGKLRIRPVDILFEDNRYAYVDAGLSGGEKIVTTNLSTVVEGSDLRVEETSTEVGEDTTKQIKEIVQE